MIQTIGPKKPISANDVTNIPSGSIGSDNIQEVVNELDSEKVPATRTINGKNLSENISLDKTDIGLGNVLNLEQKVYHGFKVLPGGTPTFVGTTFTLPGDPSYTVFIGGTESTINTQKTLDLSTLAEWSATASDNYGQWFVWLNSDLTLGASQTNPGVLDTTKTSVVTIYLQDNGSGGYTSAISRDWRDYRRNIVEQKNQHESWGAQYVSGFDSLAIGGGSPTVNTFSLAGGVFRSEDLHHIVSNPQTVCHVAYRNADSTLLIFDAADTGYSKIVGGVPVYDNSGTLTGLGNNKFGVQWIYASARITTPIISVIGQEEYDSIAEAQAAAQPSLPGFQQIEAKLLYKVIVQNKSGLLWIQTVPLYNVSTGPAISGGAVGTLSAGNVSYVPLTPDTSTNVQNALELRTYFPSGTDVAVVDGGTGASDAATARTNLGAVAKSGDTLTGYLTLHADPTSALHAVTKQYADAIAAGFGPKNACKVATTETLLAASYSSKVLTASANGALSLDGYSPSSGERVLVKDGVNVNGAGSSNVYNGIYTVTVVGDAGTPWQLTRAIDFDGTPDGEVKTGAYTFIENGLASGKSGYSLLTTGTILIDTTALTFGMVTATPSTAANVSNVPYGNIAATNVQAAINELEDEKVPTTRTVNSKALSANITLDKTDVGLGNVLNVEQKSYHGWASLSATPTFAGTTITIPGSTPYDIYIGGAKSTINTDKTFDLSTSGEWDAVTKANNYGQWYVWINANLTLGVSKSVWSVLDTTKIPVLTIYLQDAGGANYEGIISKEWHDYRRNLLEHKNQHESWGSQYVSGFNSLTIGGGSPTVNSFSLTGGTIRDEDLHQIISNPQTQCRIAYRGTGGTALIFDAAGTTYAKTSGTIPYYDNNGTLTTLGNNQYGIYWIYATTRIATPIVSVMGQGTYNNVANAQLAPQPTLTGITTAEWKLLYRVIVRNAGGALTWIQSDPLYNVSTGPAINAGTVSTISAGNVSFNPTSPDTSTNVQTALEARALLAGSSTQDFSAQNLSVSKKVTCTVGTVAAGATITIPANYTIVHITDDSASAANSLIMPSGTNGQMLWIYNEDAQATSGAFIIPSGYIGMFIYINEWKLLRGIVG